MRRFILYLLTYWCLAILLFLAVFGTSTSIEVMFMYPFKSDAFSGTLLFSSSLLASAFAYYFKEDCLKNHLYHYLAFGFSAGNLSLLILFIMATLPSIPNIKNFSDYLVFISMSFVELFFSYVVGLALMALIPSIGGAVVLYWINTRYLSQTNSVKKQ